MHPNVLLDLTTELLREVLAFSQPADAVLSRFFRANRVTDSRERQTLAETTYSVLRQRPLLLYLAQLDGELPPRAGGSPLVRRLAILGWHGNPGFLRAALTDHEQAWLARAQAIKSDNLPAKLRHNLPDWLSNPLQEQLSRDFWPLVQTLNAPAPMDLRVNTLKTTRDDARRALAEAGITATDTPYSPWGLRIQGKPAVNRLPLFTSGAIEVQDEGSQLLALLLDPQRGEMVVDFCAGAGGKTLALGAAMKSTGRLYAFDTSEGRLASFKRRQARSGLSNVHPAVIAHERDERIKRLAGKIDRVLVDAPCSGLGTLRRNPDLKWRMSPAALAELQTKQKAILASAARLLKPGGRLVYATCSLLTVENETVADAFTADAAADFEVLPAVDVLVGLQVPEAASLCEGPYLRLWPHRHATDGFFAACWVRR
jgi:16S rRNA (cytosine967-C5)-methyltransferase